MKTHTHDIPCIEPIRFVSPGFFFSSTSFSFYLNVYLDSFRYMRPNYIDCATKRTQPTNTQHVDKVNRIALCRWNLFHFSFTNVFFLGLSRCAHAIFQSDFMHTKWKCACRRSTSTRVFFSCSVSLLPYLCPPIQFAMSCLFFPCSIKSRRPALIFFHVLCLLFNVKFYVFSCILTKFCPPLLSRFFTLGYLSDHR